MVKKRINDFHERRGALMPPRRVSPMMGRNQGSNYHNPFTMGRPQRGPSLFRGNHTSPRSIWGLGMNQSRGPGRSGGLLSRISGQSSGRNSGSGGLLSRLIGGGSRGETGMRGFEGLARGGNIGSSFSQSGGLMNILNQTQSVLKSASQLQPLIEQYGPLVRNFPAMWKLYKGLKDSVNEDSDSNDKENDNQTSSSKDNKSQKKSKSSKKGKSSSKHNHKTNHTTKSSSSGMGNTRPKLYI